MQNGRHFADEIFKFPFLSEICCNNMPELGFMMALWREGEKLLFEPVVAYFADADMRHWALMTTVPIGTQRLFQGQD